jgi:hypothetical protein
MDALGCSSVNWVRTLQTYSGCNLAIAALHRYPAVSAIPLVVRHVISTLPLAAFLLVNGDMVGLRSCAMLAHVGRSCGASVGGIPTVAGRAAARRR